MLAAVGLGVADGVSITAALVILGIWAILAGALRRIAAGPRLRTGGQVALIISGAISILAPSSSGASAGRRTRPARPLLLGSLLGLLLDQELDPNLRAAIRYRWFLLAGALGYNFRNELMHGFRRR